MIEIEVANVASAPLNGAPSTMFTASMSHAAGRRSAKSTKFAIRRKPRKGRPHQQCAGSFQLFVRTGNQLRIDAFQYPESFPPVLPLCTDKRNELVLSPWWPPRLQAGARGTLI